MQLDSLWAEIPLYPVPFSTPASMPTNELDAPRAMEDLQFSSRKCSGGLEARPWLSSEN